MLSSSGNTNPDPFLYENIEEIVGPIECGDFDINSFMFANKEHHKSLHRKQSHLTERDLDYIENSLKVWNDICRNTKSDFRFYFPPRYFCGVNKIIYIVY